MARTRASVSLSRPYRRTANTMFLLREVGEPGWDRTIDTLIKSQVLYH